MVQLLLLTKATKVVSVIPFSRLWPFVLVWLISGISNSAKAGTSQTYFPERRPSPQLRVQTVLPMLVEPVVGSCSQTLGADPRLGVIYVDHGNTLPSQGQHRPVFFENSYQVGGFDMMSQSRVDRYVGFYEWRRGATEIPSGLDRPARYDKIVSSFRDEWRALHPEWKDVDTLYTSEASHDWRRTSFITMAFDSYYFAGARLFDGNSSPVLMNEAGHRVASEGIGLNESARLPLQARFPGVEIQGRKIEIGWMTSNPAIEASMPTIFYKLARLILEKYGEGSFNKVVTNIPRYLESEQLGTVNIGGPNMIANVRRFGPSDINFQEPVVYFDFIPDHSRSLEALHDLYIYLVAKPRMAKIYGRTVKGVEELQALDSERTLMRLRASDFVDQFYFGPGQVDPGLTERARQLRAYKKADIDIRRNLLEESRKQRRWRDIARKAVEEVHPGGRLEDFDVTIRGNYMQEGAPLDIQIIPKFGSQHWDDLFSDDEYPLEDYF